MSNPALSQHSFGNQFILTDAGRTANLNAWLFVQAAIMQTTRCRIAAFYVTQMGNASGLFNFMRATSARMQSIRGV
jgi:hypothetical protein